MQLDSFPVQMDGGEAVLAEADEIQRNAAETEAQRHLFDSCYIFLSREVPRYTLEFVVAACGGKVSWAGIGNVGGGPFAESDPRITHHVVDRPSHKVLAAPLLHALAGLRRLTSPSNLTSLGGFAGDRLEAPLRAAAMGFRPHQR